MQTALQQFASPYTAEIAVSTVDKSYYYAYCLVVVLPSQPAKTIDSTACADCRPTQKAASVRRLATVPVEQNDIPISIGGSFEIKETICSFSTVSLVISPSSF